MSDDIVKQWMEADEPPITNWLPGFGRPPYAQPTITEKIEPYWSQYVDLYATIGETLNTQNEDGDWEVPSERYWTPTAPMRDMLRRLQDLWAIAWQEILNPDYDPVRAAAWEEKQKARFSQQTYYTGQSYTPEFTKD